MNITKENTGELTATVKIQLSADDYQQKVNNTLKKEQKKATMPGFRPGKVPFGMIEKIYGKTVFADEIGKIINESLTKYITDNKISILGNPLPNKEKENTDKLDNKNFEFLFDLGLSPKFELNLSDKIKLNLYNITIDDKFINNYINTLRQQYGELVNSEISKDDDLLYGEFEELDNKGNLLKNGIKNKNSISLKYIKNKTIKNKLTGVKKENKITLNPFEVTESEEETASLLGVEKEKIKDLKSKFLFTVKEIKKTVPAKIDNYFFDKVYPQKNIKNKKQLFDHIKKDMSLSLNNEAENKLTDNIILKILKETKIKLPEEFLKRWIIETNEKEITKEQIDKEFDVYANSLRWQLIKNKIIKNNNIKVTEEEVKNDTKKILKQQYKQLSLYKDSDKNFNAIVENALKNKKEVEKIYTKLYEEKIIDFIKTNIKIVKKDITYNEFIKLNSNNKK